ncbi:hypothetical protein GDN83_23095 [Gordonia jinghuaiqii]|uniref:Transposase n=1 Tax=Gordonia jinghuaiqii TaxID=2758710 RepID=A0A7D7LZI6_9ACTN|nr:hypothetical protein [Gordonia jinghuaiqii]MCR5980574.1 hypothetical protein [Gordonia jinghuaiqii]QMT02634.1 hypothetical protein H1R19_05680 [Gordonia jinghuaiqii]
MHGLRHPFSGALYEPEENELVRVTTRAGQIGIYSKDGRRVSGDKIDVDPQMTGWIASKRGVHRMVNTASH